jgi:branched-subunit amino acid transport protein
MMDVRPEILLIVLGAALVTVVPRVLPLVVLTRFDLPAGLKSWLAYVPIAILAALLAAELALEQGAIVAKWRDLVAVLPVLAVVAVSRSIIGAVVAGVLAIALLRGIA